jgi:hypothetical protein
LSAPVTFQPAARALFATSSASPRRRVLLNTSTAGSCAVGTGADGVRSCVGSVVVVDSEGVGSGVIAGREGVAEGLSEVVTVAVGALVEALAVGLGGEVVVLPDAASAALSSPLVTMRITKPAAIATTAATAAKDERT